MFLNMHTNIRILKKKAIRKQSRLLPPQQFRTRTIEPNPKTARTPSNITINTSIYYMNMK